MANDSLITGFIQATQQATARSRTNGDIEKILYAGDQNTASQVVLSLSQAMNSMGSDTRENATAGSEK